jgi:hypothetical protein
VLCPGPSPVASRPARPSFEIADVFRAHGEEFRQSHALSGDQRKAMRDIEACRTEVLGGHVDVCPKCDYRRIAFNSCRNRHCPKCPAVVQARWIEKRTARLLPTHYFHAVLTLPPSLRPLVRRNREALFTLLLTTASKTLIELGEDPDRLGGQLGVTTVLHSWTRKLEFHPHAHCIVTGGGLDRAGQHWVPTSRKFLFPIDAGVSPRARRAPSSWCCRATTPRLRRDRPIGRAGVARGAWVRATADPLPDLAHTRRHDGTQRQEETVVQPLLGFDRGRVSSRGQAQLLFG